MAQLPERTLRIRPADPLLDAAACAEIYAPFVAASAVSFEEVVPDEQEFTWRIERISARYPWLIAEDDEGAVAGYAYASSHRERAAYRWAADVAVYVREGFQGRGFGKALYGALLELLAEQGVRTVCGGVTLPNPASVALHEACGFELVGIYRKIGFKWGAWHDVGWWQLDLQPDSSEPPSELGPPVEFEDR